MAPPRTPPGPPAVEVEGARRRFGRQVALDGVSLEVAAGEVLAVAGANGSGKTTLLRILAGLVDRDGGTVRVLGLDPREGRRRVLERARFAFAPPALFEELTAREHVTRLPNLAGPRVERRAAERALERVGLADRADEPVAGFSFGMRQRLALALALLPPPELLVLDEPSEGLDPRGVRDLRALLRELAGGGTAVLFASHLLHEVERVADRVVLLDGGRVVASGGTADLVGPPREVQVEVRGGLEALRASFGAPVVEADGRAVFRLDAARELAAVAAEVERAGGHLTEFRTVRPSLEQALLERLEARADR